MMNDDMGLVREYAACRSEQAFETLVSRHIGLVHSAALRQVRNPHLAEEITQTVFIILARKAGSLNQKTILPGWLYRTTRYVSAAAMKIQRRRERHEQEAHWQAMMQQTPTDSAWEPLAPLLDDAMAQLRDTDRDAIVLRYFQNKSLREVGARLGVDEYAAQKRVGRAVEKLRFSLVKRGLVSTTAIITGAISVNSVQAAPGALAKSVTAVALAKGAAASGSTLTLIKGALKLIAWTKAKTAVVVGIAAILTTSTAIIAFNELNVPRGNSLLAVSVMNTTNANGTLFYVLSFVNRDSKPVRVRGTWSEIPGDPRKLAETWNPNLPREFPSGLLRAGDSRIAAVGAPLDPGKWRFCVSFSSNGTTNFYDGLTNVFTAKSPWFPVDR
jgi:RNA polymerase sigma factor (sigma-70 family)